MSAERLPSVSVVIPTRERPEFLREAVRSVLDQCYNGPIEALVVFDGSEPRELQALSADGDRRVTVLTNDRKPGPL